MTALVGEASCAEGLLSLLISRDFDLPQGLAVFLERCLLSFVADVIRHGVWRSE